MGDTGGSSVGGQSTTGAEYDVGSGSTSEYGSQTGTAATETSDWGSQGGSGTDSASETGFGSQEGTMDRGGSMDQEGIGSGSGQRTAQ